MEPVKICHFKTLRAGNFAFNVAFFSTTYMLRSLFVKIFQQNMSLNQRNLRGVPIDLKSNNLDLSGNTTDSKHYRRAHVHIDIYCFIYLRWNLSKCVVLKHFGWVFLHGEPCIFARGTLYFCTGNLVFLHGEPCIFARGTAGIDFYSTVKTSPLAFNLYLSNALIIHKENSKEIRV